jgi:hypothetical protein
MFRASRNVELSDTTLQRAIFFLATDELPIQQACMSSFPSIDIYVSSDWWVCRIDGMPVPECRQMRNVALVFLYHIYGVYEQPVY